jgi:hypothetical protein
MRNIFDSNIPARAWCKWAAAKTANRSIDAVGSGS